MDKLERLKERVRLAVVEFCEKQLAVRGEAAWVDFHPHCILVTITAASSPAERDCARDKGTCARLERLYGDLFEASKEGLEAAIGNIVGQPVLRSWLSVDPESGDHVMRFAFAEENCERQERGHRSPIA